MLLRKVGIVLVATSAGTVMSSYIWLCACVELYLVPSLVLVNKRFVISTKRTHTKLNRLRDIRRRKKKKKKLERQPDTFFFFFFFFHFVPIPTLRRGNSGIVLRKVRIPILRNKVRTLTLRRTIIELYWFPLSAEHTPHFNPKAFRPQCSQCAQANHSPPPIYKWSSEDTNSATSNITLTAAPVVSVFEVLRPSQHYWCHVEPVC